MDSVETESVMGINDSEMKNNKSETRLPFSIENLLADKFVEVNGKAVVDGEPSTSAETVLFKEFSVGEVGSHAHDDSDDDRVSSTSSENVDVESSGGGDVNDFIDAKKNDYLLSGKQIIKLN